MKDLQYPGANPNRSAAARKLWADPEYRRKHTQTCRARRHENSKIMKQLWQDPEYRAKQLSALEKNRGNR